MKTAGKIYATTINTEALTASLPLKLDSNKDAISQAIDLSTTEVTNTLPYTKGGTGLSSLGTALQLLRINSGGTALEYFTPSYITGNQTITLSGDVTGSGTTAITTTIANDAVTYAKMQNVSATNRLLGRITTGAGDVEELTGAQATTLLDVFSSTLKGLTPASGGGTTNFLRADGTWVAPAGGGTVTSVAATAPSAGFTISGSPITGSGTFVFTLTDDLAAVEGIATTGIVRRTASNTWSAGTTVAVTEGGTGLTSLTQGDILYTSASNTLSALAKDINATRYLSNTGTSNNPAWAQINLANGVTGNLSVTNLNSGTSASSSTFWRGDGSWSSVAASNITSGATLSRTNDTNVTLTLGGTPTTALLAATSLTLGWTGQLSLARGGTGSNLTDPNADRILFWDDSAGVVTWLTAGSGLSISGTTISATGGGGSVSFGTEGQIPVTNAGGTDFDYTAALTFDTEQLFVGAGVSTNAAIIINSADSADTVSVLNFQSGTLDKWGIGLSGYSGLDKDTFYIFEQADSGLPRVAITPGGNFYITTLETGGTAPTTSGTTRSVICDANGMLSFTTAGTGTVTSVAATAPAAGFTISGSPITTSGTLAFTLADDLAALEAMSGTGLVVRTASNTYAQRTITGTINRLSVTNGDGVSGNPTIDISSSYVGQNTITTLGTVTTGTLSTGAVVGGVTMTLGSDANYDIYYRNSSGILTRLAAGTDGYVLTTHSTTSAPTWTNPSGGSGTVTSVGITAPAAGITVSGSPVTTSGSMTLALADDLAALEAMSSTGIVTRTASNTYAQRTITGTTNRLTVTNGDGVSGNPTLDISASYVGQTSITTLGTIGTGTWNGSVVAGQYGGTGVANTGKTITLGGNLTTSGAFASTFTMTGTTGVTFPTTGILATLAGSEALTNKSVNGVTLVNGGTSTLYLSQDGTYSTPSGGGSGVSFGTAGQIPYTNATTDDFDYGGVKFTGTDLEIQGQSGLYTYQRLKSVGAGTYYVEQYVATGGDVNTTFNGNNFRIVKYPGNYMLAIGTSEISLNDAGLNIDIRMEGDNDANLLFLDAGVDKASIGSASNLGSKFNVTSTSTQQTWYYDTSNYATITVSSGGDLTIAPTGGDTTITGRLIISSLDTGGTAPTTSGTTKMVIVDGDGLLSFDDIPSGGGSISFGADNQIPYTNSTTDDFDYSSNFKYDGAKLVVGGGGEFAQLGVGTTVTSGYGININSTASVLDHGIAISGTYGVPTSSTGYLAGFGGTLVEPGSGTNSLLANLHLSAPTVTSGGATVTNTATLYIDDAMSATVSGKNYALWIDGGENRFDGLFNAGGTSLTANQLWGANSGATAMEGKTLTSSDSTVTITHGSGSIDLKVATSLVSGTYTPTVTNISNVTSTTPHTAKYTRVGNTVHVAVQISITPTAGSATATSFRIDLPVASDFSTIYDCSGVVACKDFGNMSGEIYADDTNNEAIISFKSQTASLTTISLQFDYEILVGT